MPNKIDRNANTHPRHQTNWQRLVEGAVTGTIIVGPPLHNDGTTITFWESVGEVPSGTVNGSNTVFTLANTPVSGKEKVYLNGQRMVRGGSDDYTISGAVITFTAAPKTGDKITVDSTY